MKKISILIADDHPIVLLGLRFVIESLGHTVEAEFSNGIECLNYLIRNEPTMAFVDINMPGMNGIEVLTACVKGKINTKIVLLTIFKEISIYNKAMKEGAAAYLPKELMLEEIEAAIAIIQKEGTYKSKSITDILIRTKQKTSILDQFTPMQRKVIIQITEKNSSYEIAENLYISKRTVDGHRNSISKILNLKQSESTNLSGWVNENLEEIRNSNYV